MADLFFFLAHTFRVFPSILPSILAYASFQCSFNTRWWIYIFLRILNVRFWVWSEQLPSASQCKNERKKKPSQTSIWNANFVSVSHLSFSLLLEDVYLDRACGQRRLLEHSNWCWHLRLLQVLTQWQLKALLFQELTRVFQGVGVSVCQRARVCVSFSSPCMEKSSIMARGAFTSRHRSTSYSLSS